MDKKNVFIRSLSYIEPVIAFDMRKAIPNRGADDNRLTLDATFYLKC